MKFLLKKRLVRNAAVLQMGTVLAEGEEDVLQPENQHKALRARFVDQPELRHPDRIGDNSHIVAGDMSIEEWERSRVQNEH